MVLIGIFFVVQIGMACTLVVLSSMYFCDADWYGMYFSGAE